MRIYGPRTEAYTAPFHMSGVVCMLMRCWSFLKLPASFAQGAVVFSFCVQQQHAPLQRAAYEGGRAFALADRWKSGVSPWQIILIDVLILHSWVCKQQYIC